LVHCIDGHGVIEALIHRSWFGSRELCKEFYV